jgi:hypothetical protein
MSKRNAAVLLLAVLFALSVTAFAVAPAMQSDPAPAEGQAVARLFIFGDEKPVDTPPECPSPGSPGCGGG